MSFPYFIAKRIYNDDRRTGKVSRPAVTIAVAGIAIGMVVMILSIGIAIGFKQEIKEKVIGFGSHIQVANLNRTISYGTTPVVAGDSLLQIIRDASADIANVQRFTNKPGLLMTEHGFHGIVLKGIGQEYDTSFIASCLQEGQIPYFTDSVASGEVLISRHLADKMRLSVGDKIDTYYIQKNVRTRRFTVAGIYKTNFTEYDSRFLITDIYTASRLNNWKDAELVGGIEVNLRNDASLASSVDSVGAVVNHRVDKYGNAYLAQDVETLFPAIFAWLDVLDTNVVVILVLMIGVAGFTMISGLLILILERTNMIGVLKALGASDASIRHIFLYFSVFLIGKGMLYGNVIGLSLCLLQYYAGVVKLDPATYYVDAVPIAFDGVAWLALNVVTLFVSVMMLLGPSFLISRIKPATSIRFE